MKTKTNRDKFIQLRAQLGMTEEGVAEFLTTKTKRPVKYRTVQSWSTDPSKDSARNCQDWVIELMQEELDKRNRKAGLQD